MAGKIVQEGQSPVCQGDPMTYLAEVVYPQHRLLMVLKPDIVDPVTGKSDQQYQVALWKGWAPVEVPAGVPWDNRQALMAMPKAQYDERVASQAAPDINMGDRGGYGERASLEDHIRYGQARAQGAIDD